jgi:hypothetical protein
VPLPRILLLVFAVAAVVAVLGHLVSFPGPLPDAAAVLALLAVAARTVLVVRGPVARAALTAGFVLLAAVPVTGWVLVDDLPALLSGDDIARIHQQAADADHAAVVLLLLAAAALTVGVAALPGARRPVWQTVLACVVALGPVAIVVHVATEVPALLGVVPSGLRWHVAPGLAATVLAGLAVVLAVSRADRRFLLPVGALLVQVAAARWTESAAGSWTLAQLYGGINADTFDTFLSPGLRTEVPAGAAPALDVEVGAALTTVALLLGPALITLGAARAARAADARVASAGPEQAPEA